jgi:hypothetical protein
VRPLLPESSDIPATRTPTTPYSPPVNPRHLAVALRTYLLPLPHTLAFRLSLLGAALVFVIAFLARIMGQAGAGSPGELSGELGAALLMPGVPIFALLVSELPIREGIRHRTLLYPLLGPVPRGTLAGVRTGATALVFSVAIAIVVVVVEWLGGQSPGSLGGELAAAALGGLAFTSVFGLIQALLSRGLAAGLLWYILIDESIAKIPFELCRLSVSYHVRVLGGVHEFFGLPVADLPAEQPLASALLLVVIAVLAVTATVAVFRRRDLGELC